MLCGSDVGAVTLRLVEDDTAAVRQVRYCEGNASLKKTVPLALTMVLT